MSYPVRRPGVPLSLPPQFQTNSNRKKFFRIPTSLLRVCKGLSLQQDERESVAFNETGTSHSSTTSDWTLTGIPSDHRDHSRSESAEPRADREWVWNRTRPPPLSIYLSRYNRDIERTLSPLSRNSQRIVVLFKNSCMGKRSSLLSVSPIRRCAVSHVHTRRHTHT